MTVNPKSEFSVKSVQILYIVKDNTNLLLILISELSWPIVGGDDIL